MKRKMSEGEVDIGRKTKLTPRVEPTTSSLTPLQIPFASIIGAFANNAVARGSDRFCGRFFGINDNIAVAPMSMTICSKRFEPTTLAHVLLPRGLEQIRSFFLGRMLPVDPVIVSVYLSCGCNRTKSLVSRPLDGRSGPG